CILFLGMLAVSVSELINHNFWNLVAVVFLIVLLGVLRAINKAPTCFSKKATKLWDWTKKKWFSKLTN
ncbi:MAG: hypothetical protein J5873_01295, partial [Bacteroidales bacterium]|nr:hypothetical protein [Bacteroidales bacterium]